MHVVVYCDAPGVPCGTSCLAPELIQGGSHGIAGWRACATLDYFSAFSFFPVFKLFTAFSGKLPDQFLHVAGAFIFELVVCGRQGGGKAAVKMRELFLGQADGGSGDVAIWVASETAAQVGSASVAAALAATIAAAPICDTPSVTQCPALSIVVSGNIYYQGSSPQSAVEAALTAFANGLPINGNQLNTTQFGVSLADVIQTIINSAPPKPMWTGGDFYPQGQFIWVQGNIWLATVPGIAGSISPNFPTTGTVGVTTITDGPNLVWTLISTASNAQSSAIVNATGIQLATVSVPAAAADIPLSDGASALVVEFDFLTTPIGYVPVGGT